MYDIVHARCFWACGDCLEIPFDCGVYVNYLKEFTSFVYDVATTSYTVNNSYHSGTYAKTTS